jgi:hypothetical protein
VKARLVSGEGGNGFPHHRDDRRDLRALFGGSIPGMSRGVPSRFEAGCGERRKQVRGSAGLGLRAALLDGCNDVGQRSSVARREHIGQRPEGVGEHPPESVGLRLVVGFLAGFAEL